MRSGAVWCETKCFCRGEVIAKAGAVGCEAYLIRKGRVAVEVTTNGKSRRVTQSEGDVVGEMALVDQSPRCATLTALDDVVVEVITLTDFHSILNPCHPIVRAVVKGLVKRLRATN